MLIKLKKKLSKYIKNYITTNISKRTQTVKNYIIKIS
jgi:hypothetical protein